MAKLRAEAVAGAARAWLAAARPARVLNVFDRACNLVADDGAVLALVTAARGLTPFGVVVEPGEPPPFAGVDAASPVSVAADALRVGPLAVELRGAAAWDARPNWAAVVAALKSHPQRPAALAVAGLEAAPRDSLLCLWHQVEPATPLLARVRPAAQNLIAGLQSGDWARSEQGVLKLAGLGGGLTPAGDDFVLGVMLAAHAGAFGLVAAQHCLALAEALAPRTNTLSAAYVHAAARGECAAYWHDQLAALSNPAADLSGPARALVSVGHTSGADALAGFLASFERAAGLQ
ncbi:MAG: DUF2877 domain-containing protein [Anaerolineales bacterium]|nr:DUF2877 domain-containing protein [Anaerolineales bacterium]